MDGWMDGLSFQRCTPRASTRQALLTHEVFKRVDLRDRFFFFGGGEGRGYSARGFRRFGTIEAIPPETDGWQAHRF